MHFKPKYQQQAHKLATKKNPKKSKEVLVKLKQLYINPNC
jgi:hypothetical protein